MIKNRERNQQIIDLWNKGIAAKDIMRQLGITKNTIIGVVDRNRDVITRPAIYCNREKGRTSAMLRWGLKRKKDRAAARFSLHCDKQ